jgi:hypothetical protein
MANLTYQTESVGPVRRTHWGAIWAGVFIFAAIWSVFGLLGMAIFSSAANSATGNPASGTNVGLGIWAIILSIIAMYVAGYQTGRLANVSDRNDRLIHGMIMFGLSVAAIVVVSAMGGYVSSSASANNVYGYHGSTGAGWETFLAFFLGWLAAMIGATSAGAGKLQMDTTSNVRDIRPAA